MRAQWSEARDYLMMNGATRLLLAVAREHEKRALLGTVRKTRELPEGLVGNPQGRRGISQVVKT